MVSLSFAFHPSINFVLIKWSRYGADYIQLAPNCPEACWWDGDRCVCSTPLPSISPPLPTPSASCITDSGDFICPNGRQTVTRYGKPCDHAKGGCNNRVPPSGSGYYWCYFLDQAKAVEEGWGWNDRQYYKGRYDYCSMNDYWDYEGNVSS